ncbi:MAG: hypothetical protein FWE38_04740 [Firmicutes bacterium]|nr:hypothetical protein [Bacillota bacterium]
MGKQKSEVIQILKTQYTFMYECENALAEYHRYNYNIEATKSQARKVIQGRNKNVDEKIATYTKRRNRMFGVSIVLFLLTVGSVLMGMLHGYDISSYFASENFILDVIFICSLFLLAIPITIFLSLRLKKYKEQIQEANFQTQNQAAGMITKYDEEATFLMLKAKTAFDAATSLTKDGGVHSDWLNTQLIAYIVQHMENGAADNIKEALVLFKSDSNFAQLHAKIDESTMEIKGFIQESTAAIVSQVAASTRFLSWQNTAINNNINALHRRLNY